MGRKFSRFLTVVTVLILTTVGLTACGGGDPDDVPGNNKLSVPTTITMSVGEKVYYLDGVQAWENDTNITHLVTVTAPQNVIIKGDGTFGVTKVGEYTITYNVTINQKVQTKTTTLKVVS